MPSSDRYVAEAGEGDYIVIPDWKPRPFPSSWEEFKDAVDAWIEAAWGPDWHCSNCGNRFWSVLEPVLLPAAAVWPGRNRPNTGAYPVVPVGCARCAQVRPILLAWIFERLRPEEDSAGD